MNLSPTRSRLGFTLLELLVVIFIISILLAIAIPALKPNAQEAALRESARMVNSALATARTRAQQTGRPYGVMFSPLPSTPNASITLHYVQVPPPYAGDTINSRMVIRSSIPTVVDPISNPNGIYIWTISMPSFDQLVTNIGGANETSDDNVQPGDLLKLNFQGHAYEVLAITDGGSGMWNLTVRNRTIVRLPAMAPSGNIPNYQFQFLRRPRKSSATPMQLPESVAIDLSMSGTDFIAFQFNPTAPKASNVVAITFSPTGRIDRLFHPARPGGERLLSTAHFLIGKTGNYGMDNVMDLDNIWVSIGHQTGVVTSTENACVDLDNDGNCDVPLTTGSYTAEQRSTAINQARVHARTGQGMGG